jgi:hypothetical protein
MWVFDVCGFFENRQNGGAGQPGQVSLLFGYTQTRAGLQAVQRGVKRLHAFICDDLDVVSFRFWSVSPYFPRLCSKQQQPANRFAAALSA